MARLKVGLLSQQINRLKRGRSVCAAILEILERAPDLDLLLCAGYSLSSLRQLERVESATVGRRVVIAAELGSNKKKKRKKGAALYWIARGKSVAVGAQASWTSVSSCEDAENAILAWEDRMAKTPKGIPPVLWISCGEVFVFRHKIGSQKLVCRFRKLQDRATSVVRKAGIVLNPTHDRMPRLHHIDSIGAALTRGKRKPSAYFRATNWNTTKRQQRDMDLLHRAIVDGVKEDLTETPSVSNRFMFSYIAISKAKK